MNKLAIDGGTPVRTEAFAEWPVFGELEERMVTEAIRSGKWGGSGVVKGSGREPMLPLFERKFAELQDAEYAVNVVNGTVAITVALQAAGVKPGDEVIVPPYTFIATATAALAYGAIPVFADIEEHTLMLDPDKAEQAITPRTKAVIPVHLAGASADMDRFTELGRKYGLSVIEDAAQAAGAAWKGKGVGSHGTAGTFSFQSSKNLNAGEGGVLLTNDSAVWERAWSICNVGRVPGGEWYGHKHLGQNYRMTELQAALLLAQMTRLEEQMQTRERNAALLDGLLEEVEGIVPPFRDERVTRHANHLYMFRIDPAWTDRIAKTDFIRKLQAEGIPASAGYFALNRNEAIIGAIRDWTGAERIDACPVCERVSDKEVVWLGQQVLLSDEKAIRDVALAVRKVVSSY